MLGILTDGDVRRMLLREQKPVAALFVDDVIVHANMSPTVVAPDARLDTAIALMEEREIWDLPVVDDEGMLRGVLHLHPVVKALLGRDTPVG